MNREERAEEVKIYLNKNYKPKVIDFENDGDHCLMPVFSETIYPTIADYIEEQITAAEKRGRVEVAFLFLTNEDIYPCGEPDKTGEVWVKREVISKIIDKIFTANTDGESVK